MDNINMTLYDKLKPEIKAKLEENYKEYKTVGFIFDKLQKKDNYSDLTIDDMKTVHLFSNTDYVNQTGLEFIWGEKIFDKYGRND